MTREPQRRDPDREGFRPSDGAFVTAIWDDARTARLSELYYGKRTTSLTRLSFTLDFAIAVTASGSGVAGWTLWTHPHGQLAWGAIAGAAALAAIVKPMLGLDRKLTRFARQQQIYRTVLSALEGLVDDIQQDGTLTREHRQRYRRARDRLAEAQLADETDPSETLRTSLAEAVNREMPPDRLWLPPVTQADPVAA